jgi:hypothetical protein
MSDGWSSNGNGSGVWGGTDSTNGVGVVGHNYAGGSGVHAESDSGAGLVARSASGNPIMAFGSSAQDVEFSVSNTGNVYADGTFNPGGADFAEMLPAHTGLKPGDVLIIGLDGKLTRSTQAYQTTVVGVYSTQPGFVGGASDEADLTGKIPLAVMGVVPVKVSAENGAIRPGDLLTTSSIPGHAMKAGANSPIGTVIGKALGSLTSGTGVIQMLVILQ